MKRISSLKIYMYLYKTYAIYICIIMLLEDQAIRRQMIRCYVPSLVN